MSDMSDIQNKYSKKLIILIVAAVIIFWISETILIAVNGEGYPNYFVYAWFTFWGVELVSLAGIKITEAKNPYADVSKEEEPVG